MKTVHACIVSLHLGLGRLLAADPNNEAIVVIERGPHHKTTERTVVTEGPNGPVTRKALRVELATGLHYHTENGWAESDATISPHPNGAVAHNGQHKAAFAANLNTFGAIQVVDPDGKKYTSHVLGLAYTDASNGQSVTIATVKDSVGQILAPSQIVYVDAFNDVKADVRYTYRRNGLEQDIIIRESLPSPADFQLNPDTTRLEVMTEFTTVPQPNISEEIISSETDQAKRQTMAIPDFIDQRIEFGAMRLGKGKAIGLQGVAVKDVPVAKTWLTTPDNRSFLIEGVQFPSIASGLGALPQRQAKLDASTRTARTTRKSRLFPNAPRERAAVDRKPMKQMAQLSAMNRPGLLVDWVINLSGGLTNQTFQPEGTYYVTGPVDVYGTTRFVGGTVVKYADGGASPLIAIHGPVICETAPYRPAIFTAVDDQSVGDYVGATAFPFSQPYAAVALYADTGASGELHDLRFLYADQAIFWNSDTNRFSNLQFYNCVTVMSRFACTNCAVDNILITNSYEVFAGGTSKINASHVTVNNAYFLSSLGSSTLAITNSVLVDLVSIGANVVGDYIATNNSPPIASVTHGFSPSSPLFHTVGGGQHYLASNSPIRNVGTTNLSPALLADLAKATTYPPQFLNNTITTDLTLSPFAPRDNDIPDLGYHYPPLDYIVSGFTISNATLIVTNGAAIGVDYGSSPWGLIFDNAKLLSTGSPLDPNRFVRAHCVQETSSGNPGTRALIHDGPSATVTCEIRCRFNEWSQLAQDGYAWYVGDKFTNSELSHSAFHNITFIIDAGSTGHRIGITNNVFEWGDLYFSGISSLLHAQNNLIRSNHFNIPNGNTNWNIRDNLFDTAILDNGGSVTASNNAYFQCSNVFGGGGNQILTNLNYQVGPLSRFYQSNTSPLLNAGSLDGTNVGLYHFTCTTNQVKEANSVVDIGPHWVALDSNNHPLDYDGDGLPDYYEDNSGNGTLDSGETDWLDANDLGFRIYITRPPKNGLIP